MLDWEREARTELGECPTLESLESLEAGMKPLPAVNALASERRRDLPVPPFPVPDYPFPVFASTDPRVPMIGAERYLPKGTGTFAEKPSPREPSGPAAGGTAKPGGPIQ